MTYLTPNEREERIAELEGYRDDWQKMIDSNASALVRLAKLKNAGVDVDRAIINATEAGLQLNAAKGNIEAAITRVRSGEA